LVSYKTLQPFNMPLSSSSFCLLWPLYRVMHAVILKTKCAALHKIFQIQECQPPGASVNVPRNEPFAEHWHESMSYAELHANR